MLFLSFAGLKGLAGVGPPRACAFSVDKSSCRCDLDPSVPLLANMWIFPLFSASLVGLTGIIPLFILDIDTKTEAGLSNTHKTLLGFAVGSLLGDVFLHLLPEVYSKVGMNWTGNWYENHLGVGLWIMAGLLAFMLIQKLASKTEARGDGGGNVDTSGRRTQVNCHEDERRQSGVTQNGVTQNGVIPNGVTQVGVAHPVDHVTVTPANPSHLKGESKIDISGYLNLAANCTDNFTHGLAIAASYTVGTKVGVLTTVAILLHEIPHEVGDFAILLNAGFDRWSAAKAQIATASGGIVGAVTGLIAEEVADPTVWILPFTAGGFIYIAMVTILPQLVQEQDVKQSVRQLAAIGIGIAVMVAVSYIEVLY